jgi:hypothetical protein
MKFFSVLFFLLAPFYFSFIESVQLKSEINTSPFAEEKRFLILNLFFLAF